MKRLLACASMVTLFALLAAGCTTHQDADTAVPGANTAGAATRGAPASSSTASPNR